MKQTISKQDWVTGLGCLGMAWYGMRAAYELPSESELFRMEQGREIGRLARQLFANGTLVQKSNGTHPAQINARSLPERRREHALRGGGSGWPLRRESGHPDARGFRVACA